jgi:uridylate kinase
MKKARYKRVLLKISGAALTGDKQYGIDFAVASGLARQIKQVVDMGVEMGIVVGGGNIWRGSTAAEMGMERTTADYAGMLATLLPDIAGHPRKSRRAHARSKRSSCGIGM